MKSTVIIGAGMAGIACAKRLSEAGQRVLVVDKGRAVGGRMATRRVETPYGRAQFDHGAQFFTARDGVFRRALDGIATAVALWTPNDATQRAQARSALAPEPRFVGAPGMRAVAQALARGLDVRTSTHVAVVHREGAGWLLQTEGVGVLGPFDHVIVATPAEQAVLLLRAHHPGFAAQAAAARTAPCWAGLFAVAPPTSPPFEALRLSDHPILSWIACDSTKPGRPGDCVCWVAHARADWSAGNLERAPEVVAPILAEALQQLSGGGEPVVWMQAHRWRFALVERPAETPFAWDGGMGLGVCGDWRIGPRVEAAWLSGHQLAGAVLA
jgi:renalase